MFKGYNLDLTMIDNQSFFDITDLEIDGFDKEMQILKNDIKNNMQDITLLPKTADNKIDGSKLINNLFPNYHADVFISHSHNDARTAKRLACWLNKNFGLITFIDSVIWGSANDLLRNIDNEYSISRRDKYGKPIYDYNIRNYTTSHVHMMLSTALNDIINSTECLIFLNTPESLAINEVKKQKTNSPWIYNELKIASIIEKKNPRRIYLKENIEKRAAVFNEESKNKLEILYRVEQQLNIFENLDSAKLKKWLLNYNLSDKSSHPLDILYFDNRL